MFHNIEELYNQRGTNERFELVDHETIVDHTKNLTYKMYCDKPFVIMYKDERVADMRDFTRDQQMLFQSIKNKLDKMVTERSLKRLEDIYNMPAIEAPATQ